MNRRFILVTNRTTAEQDQAFKDQLNAKYPGNGWWHWLGETWLIVDPFGRLDAAIICELARESFPGIYNLVIEIPPGDGTWAGFGLTTPPTNMFEWLHTTWKVS
jgi:hypothetical protein